jgi:hypothetical protein
VWVDGLSRIDCLDPLCEQKLMEGMEQHSWTQLEPQQSDPDDILLAKVAALRLILKVDSRKFLVHQPSVFKDILIYCPPNFLGLLWHMICLSVLLTTM